MPLPLVALLANGLRAAGAMALRAGAASARIGAAAGRGAATASRSVATAGRSAAAAAQSATSSIAQGSRSFSQMANNVANAAATMPSGSKQGSNSAGFFDHGKAFKDSYDKFNGQLKQLGESAASTTNNMDGFAKALSSSADKLREFSSAANEQAAITERDRRKRQFEYGDAVGESSAFASQEANRLEQNLNKLIAIGEQIWNFLQGMLAKAINYLLEFFRVEAITEWLSNVLNKVLFGKNAPNNQPQRTPWMDMLSNIGKPDPFAPPPVPPARP